MQIQSIATSTAQNDSGLFELNFRDERYLPFEGAGAAARMRFKLPSDFRAFDYDTISDLVVYVRYTARDGGEVLVGQTTTALNTRLMNAAQSELSELISLKRDFPAEWYKFRSQSNWGTNDQSHWATFPLLVPLTHQCGTDSSASMA